MPQPDKGVNQESKKPRKWLVLSYFSGVDGLACSHHIDDRLPELRRRGIEPLVVSSLCSFRLKGFKQWRVPSIVASGLRFELRKCSMRVPGPPWLKKALKELATVPFILFYALEKTLINIDTTWWWFVSSAPFAALAAKIFKAEAIYSTGGPVSAHLAAAIAAKLTGLPWYAELQDPLIHPYCARSKNEYKLTAFAERLICKKATRVIFLTRRAREMAAARTALGNRGTTIYSGAEPSSSAPSKKAVNQFFTMAHLGSLAGSRNLCVFLPALESYLCGNPEARDSVRFVLAGNIDRKSEELIGSFPYTGVIEDLGKLSRERTLEVMQEADLLVLIQNTDDVSPETIPSKLFEYLHTGTPILGLVYKNLELTAMLKEFGHAVASADDVDDVSVKIAGVHAAWKRCDIAYRPLPSPYTIRKCVGELVKLVEEGIEVSDDASQDTLRPEQWADALISTMECEPPTAWSDAISQWVAPEHSVLELGAGTGRLAKRLQVRRKVLMDFSESLLQVAGQVAPEAEMVHGDVLKTPWPFADKEFDVSYSVGLLEHFSDEQISSILKEQARVSKAVITLVPNAGSLLYRMWKWDLETSGKWRYAYETPKHTLYPHYEAAGFTDITEYTTDMDSIIEFARYLGWNKQPLEKILAFLSATPDSREGYLLVTIGKTT